MADASGWTDDRVELLKKLWNDGLSASQIAGELGGVTRNAVIGKVHRLGLSGRAKTPSSSSAARPRKPAPRAPSPFPRIRRRAAPTRSPRASGRSPRSGRSPAPSCSIRTWWCPSPSASPSWSCARTCAAGPWATRRMPISASAAEDRRGVPYCGYTIAASPTSRPATAAGSASSSSAPPRSGPDRSGVADGRLAREAVVQRVARPAHGADRLAAAGLAQGLAQPADMDIDRALVDLGVTAPDPVQAARGCRTGRASPSGTPAAGIRWPELHLRLAAPDPARGAVDAQIARAQLLGDAAGLALRKSALTRAISSGTEKGLTT